MANQTGNKKGAQIELDNVKIEEDDPDKVNKLDIIILINQSVLMLMNYDVILVSERCLRNNM
jgi:hypothetical protein